MIEFNSKTYPHTYLSNFYDEMSVYTMLNGQRHIFRTAEGLYQCLKLPKLTNDLIYQFRYASGAQAKRLGRDIELRDDWDEFRIKAMQFTLYSKFTHMRLKERLLATGDHELVHRMSSDLFWGSYKGRGENMLGKMLMELRGALDKRMLV